MRGHRTGWSSVGDLGVSALARTAAASQFEACFPTRSATVRWRTKLVCRQPCASRQPGGHRVRVPHLARVEFIASPYRRGHGRGEVEKPASDRGIVAQPARASHRLAEIRNRPAAPTADLVAKQAQPADVAAPDGARADHAPARLVGVGRRRELDRVATAIQFDDERRVVEVASLPMAPRRIDGLEDPAVEAHGVTARAERDPIQIHGCGGRAHHQAHGRTATSGGHRGNGAVVRWSSTDWAALGSRPCRS
jgi:hypothetical protein